MGICEQILGILQKKKHLRFVRFRDPLGNFEIFYPHGWRFDEDIAVVDGKYTVSFDSKDGCARFVVFVDAKLEPKFKFTEYAKKELESPSSGIMADLKKTKFRKMPAYEREYRFESEGRDYFGGGVMFHAGQIVFSLSWSAPEKQKETFERIFNHILKTLVVREGFSLTGKG